MKEYYALIDIKFDIGGIEAEDRKDALEKLEELFYQEYGIILDESEIIELRENE